MFKNLNIFRGLLIIGIFFNVSFALSEQTLPKESVTQTLRSHWPYQAFLAIPKISSLRSNLGVKVSSDGKILGSVRCIEIDELEQKRMFEPKTKIKREGIQRAACKAMKLAISKVKRLPISVELEFNEEIVLNFNFSTGVVSSRRAFIKAVIIPPKQKDIS
jgi:hypothetical protein